MSPRLSIASSLFVVVAVGLYWTIPPESKGQNKPGDGGQGPSKWEYKVLGREGNEKVFNELGEQGWELVAVAGEIRSAGAAGSTPPAFYFKRRK
jgi:hypothetical protein